MFECTNTNEFNLFRLSIKQGSSIGWESVTDLAFLDKDIAENIVTVNTIMPDAYSIGNLGKAK